MSNMASRHARLAVTYLLTTAYFTIEPSVSDWKGELTYGPESVVWFSPRLEHRCRRLLVQESGNVWYSTRIAWL